jgi:hypothetical protein
MSVAKDRVSVLVEITEVTCVIIAMIVNIIVTIHAFPFSRYFSTINDLMTELTFIFLNANYTFILS